MNGKIRILLLAMPLMINAMKKKPDFNIPSHLTIPFLSSVYAMDDCGKEGYLNVGGALTKTQMLLAINEVDQQIKTLEIQIYEEEIKTLLEKIQKIENNFIE